MAYIFAADSVGLSSFNFCGGLRNTHLFWNRMRIRRSRSSKVVDFGTNRKGVCDLLLGLYRICFWEIQPEPDVARFVKQIRPGPEPDFTIKLVISKFQILNTYYIVTQFIANN